MIWTQTPIYFEMPHIIDSQRAESQAKQHSNMSH